MRIGINALCADNRSGTGRYTSELLLALACLDSKNEYYVCTRPDSHLIGKFSSSPNFHIQPIPHNGAIKRTLFEQFQISGWIRKNHLDVFHGPAFMLPRHCDAPAVVTIHDLVFHLFPETVALSRRLYYRLTIPRSIRQAALILADSASTARDLHEHFQVPTAKIATVHLGVDKCYFPDPQAPQLAAVRERYHLPEQFFLTLSTLEPRKNISTLLKAYDLLIQSMPQAPDLVVAGRMGWNTDQQAMLKTISENVRPRIHFIGFVDEHDLPSLYRLSRAFICASLYEGFGLPLLEAMASGTPVIASGNSSLPEVMGETGISVNARSPESIRDAMFQIFEDPKRTQRNIEAARQRAETFSWQTTAEKTLMAYEKAYKGGL